VSDGGEAVAAAEHTEEPVAADAAPVDGVEAEAGAPRPEGSEGGEGRRRGRGRDRNRRERSPEGDVPATEGLIQTGELATAAFHEAEGEVAAAAEPVMAEPVPATLTPTMAEPTAAPVELVVAAVPPMAPVAPPAPVAPAPMPVPADLAAPTPSPAPTPAPVAAPVQAFVLPTDSLQAVAEAAGLQWVNSDADKVRAVQAAMASEPKPVHVPRERAPATVVDDGPLVLVETRKDLSQIKLPFENAQGSQPQA
jgi:ribonuclease E